MEKNIEQEDIFQKRLDEVDAEVKWRYDYINDKCCSIEDEELEVAKTIVELEVDLEVARILKNEEELKSLIKDITRNKKYLENLYEKSEVYEDLFDEVFSQVMSV
jgi:hypothetical protein